MAEQIMKGICSVSDVEAQTFPIEQIDAAYVQDCQGIIIGTPTYDGSLSGAIKVWLEGVPEKYDLSGKLTGAFATAAYVHGGGDIAVQSILSHLLFNGSLAYSGGRSYGSPVIHLGPVAIDSDLDAYAELFKIYGERFAIQLKKLPSKN